MLKQLTLVAIASVLAGCTTLTSPGPQPSDKCAQLKREWVFHHTNRNNIEAKQMTAHQREAFKRRMAEAGCTK